MKHSTKPAKQRIQKPNSSTSTLVKARTAQAVLALSVVVLAVGACGGTGESSGVKDLEASFTTVPEVVDVVPRYQLGEPLRGLSGTDAADFQTGLTAFKTAEDAADGLGPVFNGTSCVECHKQGAVGGAGDDLTQTRVTRIGGIVNGKYSDLVEVGGPVIQSRSLREFILDYPYGPEVVPTEAKYVSHRITTPLFGTGLMEAIPEATILARTKMQLPDGIAGVANRVPNIETGKMEIGRFGWKSQLSSLSVFASDAYLNEMGITSPDFPADNLPNGHALVPGADGVADPEDAEGGAEFAEYMRRLAPPSRKPLTLVAKRGEQIFGKLGCALCHVPTMSTGPNTDSTFSNKAVNCYSDLLVHHMGTELADGIIQGDATGDMFRPAPLWGLQYRKFYLHDGRAMTMEQAISSHGGEAYAAKARFMKLGAQDRSDLVEFLTSL